MISETERAAAAIRANPIERHNISAPEPEPCNFFRVDLPCIVAVVAIWAFTFFMIGSL